MGRTATGHRAIFEAIRRRDPDAARQKMLDHVGWARQEVPEHYAAFLATPSTTRKT
jgi:DNA-binding GntR family transcriptional regulator